MNGARVAFLTGEQLYLGVVSRLVVGEDLQGLHAAVHISIYKWSVNTKTIDGIVTPTIHLCRSDKERSSQQQLCHYDFNEHPDFTFFPMNQICGPPPFNGSLTADLINKEKKWFSVRQKGLTFIQAISNAQRTFP
jgi:hypothetical protein